MKRRIIAIVTAALLIFPGASVWEGSAAIAPNGSLPDQGYYAATNSFPRNTVVDITNLETGKSVRVIVAGSLDTPGLLAVLSREAAGMIGIQNRSIGRISMKAPSDPIAFSRFTEGRASSGDPDFDPQAMVASDPAASALASDPPGSPYNQAPAANIAPPSSESRESPESGNSFSDYDEIVDIPDPDENVYEDSSIASFYPDSEPEPEPVSVPVVSDQPVSVPAEETQYTETIAEAETETEAKETPEVYIPSEPSYLAESEPELKPVEADLAESSLPPVEAYERDIFISEEPDTQIQPETSSEQYDYALVPAEERPPEESSYYDIPYEIPNNPQSPLLSVEPERDYQDSILNALIIPSIPSTALKTPLAVQPTTVPPIVVPPAVEQPESVFSVPLISGLERGKYYLQLGAYSKAESVETEISRIGRAYPIAVQNGGSSDKPVYRILLGPVNLGESGALLQRFKGIGFKDAFVRSGS
jgi:hypothetical protein